MDPATIMTALQVTSAVAGAAANFSQGMDEAARLKGQEALAETQALQKDALARDELSRFLSGVRASRAANGLSATSPNAILLEKEARRVMDRDRLVAVADAKQSAANYAAAAKSAATGARISLVTGTAKAGIPLAEYGINKGWFD